MSKLLMFGLLAVIVYLILRGAGRRQRKPPPAPPTQKMVACEHCGVHLPESESLKSGEQHYCCEQHRGLGPLER
ncbi:MAG: PP0621 family protein [Proteobacteria bacterium]|nr:PP0621 family protein [Pseudomonadota bacterium]